jgi:hypothetical protein
MEVQETYLIEVLLFDAGYLCTDAWALHQIACMTRVLHEEIRWVERSRPQLGGSDVVCSVLICSEGLQLQPMRDRIRLAFPRYDTFRAGVVGH